jgi:hypothetical protein
MLSIYVVFTLLAYYTALQEIDDEQLFTQYAIIGGELTIICLLMFILDSLDGKEVIRMDRQTNEKEAPGELPTLKRGKWSFMRKKEEPINPLDLPLPPQPEEPKRRKEVGKDADNKRRIRQKTRRGR